MSPDPGPGTASAPSADGGPLGRPAAPGRGNPMLIFVTVVLGATAYCVLQAMVLPALPVIQRDLGASQATAAWLLTAFLLSASIATPILGRLGDLLGKRRVLAFVFAALSVGSLMSALTDSVGVLIAARVVQGVGGGVFPLAFGIIRDEFPPHRIPWAIGVISAVMGAASGLGVVLAGPLVDTLSWHWLFWVPLIVSALALVATIVVIPESRVRASGSVNLPAALALAAWLLALLLGLSKGTSWGWTAPGTLGLFAAAVAGFALWIWIENRSAVPLIDLKVMRIPAVWRTNVAALLLGLGMYSTFVVVPPLMQTPSEAGYGLGASVTDSGLILLPSTIASLIVGLLIGRINIRFGAKYPLVFGSALTAGSFVVLLVNHDHVWGFMLWSLLQGVGIGLAFASITSLILDAVPVEATGAATGMNANIRTIGGSLGSGVIASLLAAGTLPSGYPKESGYVAGIVVLCVATLAAAVASALVPVARRGRVTVIQPVVQSAPSDATGGTATATTAAAVVAPQTSRIGLPTSQIGLQNSRTGFQSSQIAHLPDRLRRSGRDPVADPAGTPNPAVTPDSPGTPGETIAAPTPAG
ncbi:MFS transporter [Frankia sp. CN6]|uniref:MFS transporter n=2 Tax=Frankia nepalensis TaxID=1836974 RepID=A0A937RCC0_9ACTN|nr:MFS transporter [Frankia nepalensis]